MVTCFLVCLDRLTVQTLTLSLPFYLHVEFLFTAVISQKKIDHPNVNISETGKRKTGVVSALFTPVSLRMAEGQNK